MCEHWLVDQGFKSIEIYKDPNHLLNSIPILTELTHLKPIKTYNETLTLGDALKALNEGNIVLPIMKNGDVFKILTAT